MNKEMMVDLQEKYEKVNKLLNEDYKNDPSTAPFLSKYMARTYLHQMKAVILEQLEIADEENRRKQSAMIAVVWMHLGIIAVDTEEITTGETELNMAHSLYTGHEMEPEYILVSLNTLNQLGILWSHRDNPDLSKKYLLRAQNLYLQFIALNIKPFEYAAVFKDCEDDRNDDEAKIALEKIHTFTLFYLAQIYSSINEDLTSSVYCHMTLKRQLEYNDYLPIDWAVNAATLSQYFVSQSAFKPARHHLAAATHILSEYEVELRKSTPNNAEKEEKIEELKRKSADVSRCWAKYGMHLISASMDRLMATDEEALSNDFAKFKIDPSSFITKSDLSNLFFPSLPLQTFESQVTDNYLLTFDDARPVFLSAQSWLNDALHFYTLEFHTTDHVKIIQDLSQLYDHLVLFEDNAERQCKMHKRRVDLLERLVSKINPSFYIQECRQLWFEIGETYSRILQHKVDLVKESSDNMTPHALSKINTLVDKTVKYFNTFLNSVKEAELNEIIKIPDDLERPVLKSFLIIAVVSTKYVSPDKKVQIAMNERALRYYNKIIDYCEKFESALENVPEISSCKEMAELLPLKIVRLSRNIR